MRRLAIPFLLALAASARAEHVAPEIRPRIVNGVLSWQYPTTGALLDGSNFDTATLLCSGTLIGCQTFLTAGHCVDGFLDPGTYSVFLQHAGFFHVASVALHPDYDFPAGDVAVLRLSTPVNGISPTPIAAAAPPSASPGVIAGFGRSGGTNQDYGLKRAGAVTTAACSPDISNTTSVCWVFDNPLGPPGSNSNTCNGDSGGPLFVGGALAGVTSGGSSDECLPTDFSFDANAPFYQPWIASIGGADLANTTCGALPQVEGVDTTVIALTGQVSGTTLEGRHAFAVPSGSTRLRVTMNAVDDGLSDFDLYVKAGSPPTTSDYDCRQFGPNQFGACEFPTPASGTWHVLVDRYAGAGTYQVSVALFGVDCSDPANAGRPCDDNSSCTVGDTCQAGVCVGVPLSDGIGCDDGNACTGPDACQAGACTGAAVPDGTPCQDGSLCTRNDACQNGTCTSGAAPATGCRQRTIPGRGSILMKNDALNNGRDRFTWRWQSGEATAIPEFGNPVTGTVLGLCVYDRVGGIPQLIMERALPTGAGWREANTGFRFTDRTAAQAGIRSVSLKAGAEGRSSIQLRAQGGNLGMVTLPLRKQTAVTVQLVGPNACWEAHFSTALSNTFYEFKATSD